MTMNHALSPHRNSKGAGAIYLLLRSLLVANIFDIDSLRIVHNTYDLTFTFEPKRSAKASLPRTELDDTLLRLD